MKEKTVYANPVNHLTFVHSLKVSAQREKNCDSFHFAFIFCLMFVTHSHSISDIQPFELFRDKQASNSAWTMSIIVNFNILRKFLLKWSRNHFTQKQKFGKRFSEFDSLASLRLDSLFGVFYKYFNYFCLWWQIFFFSFRFVFHSLRRIPVSYERNIFAFRISISDSIQFSYRKMKMKSS